MVCKGKCSQFLNHMVYLDQIAYVFILKFPATGMQNCDEPNVEISQDHKICFKWKICKSKLSRITTFLRFGIQILQDLRVYYNPCVSPICLPRIPSGTGNWLICVYHGSYTLKSVDSYNCIYKNINQIKENPNKVKKRTKIRNIDTIKHRNWPRIPMGTWQLHNWTSQSRAKRSALSQQVTTMYGDGACNLSDKRFINYATNISLWLVRTYKNTIKHM